MTQRNLKNYINRDPILDWLDLYGKEKGYKRDDEFIDFDKTKNFANFIKKKNEEYREEITEKLREEYEVIEVKNYKETKRCMKEGVECIKNGVIVDKVNRLYGKCDFLIKEGGVYRVMMVKYITIKKTKGGDLLNVGNVRYYKYEMTFLNEILEVMMGEDVGYGYIMGRRHERVRVDSLEDGSMIEDAVDWYRGVKKRGREWRIGGREEMFVNMCYKNDFPWHNAKKRIAEMTDEITSVWKCGVKKRKEMHEKGIYSYKKMKLGEGKTEGIIKKIVEINDNNTVNVLPLIIKCDYDEWKRKEYLEFFVDFETISDLYKDNGGMLFQIGCGYMYERKWIYKSFVVNKLSKGEEERVTKEWLEYMGRVKSKLRVRSMTRVFHWSPSEVSVYRKVRERYGIEEEIRWFDLLKIFQEEPITIKGCLNFGLKNVARALNGHGLIRTTWDNTYADGMGVMMSICSDENIRNMEMMYDIVKYNEIDCKVMSEIIEYLRKNHV